MGGGVLTYDGSVRWRIRDKRCRYEVGDIVPKLVTPKDYEYLLICDGSRFDTAQYPLLAEIFPDGVLPDLRERYLEGAAMSKQYREAGLPNVSDIWYGLVWSAFVNKTGAVWIEKENDGVSRYNMTSLVIQGEKDGVMPGKFTISLQNGNSIYGKSNTVQPASYTVIYYVCYGG